MSLPSSAAGDPPLVPKAGPEEDMEPRCLTASPAGEEHKPVRCSAAALEREEEVSLFLLPTTTTIPLCQLQCFLALAQTPLPPPPPPPPQGAEHLTWREDLRALATWETSACCQGPPARRHCFPGPWCAVGSDGGALWAHE